MSVCVASVCCVLPSRLSLTSVQSTPFVMWARQPGVVTQEEGQTQGFLLLRIIKPDTKYFVYNESFDH